MDFSLRETALVVLPALFLIPFVYLTAWFGAGNGFLFLILALLAIVFSVVQAVIQRKTKTKKLEVGYITVKNIIFAVGAIFSIDVPVGAEPNSLLLSGFMLVTYFILLAIPLMMFLELRSVNKKYRKINKDSAPVDAQEQLGNF